jgi:asparagine synthase (glutamine-hydrolysing)
MCGIAGFIGADQGAQPDIEAMVTCMHHRGPDDSGIKQFATDSARVALGNVRLAIIDLSAAGHMPMPNPDTGNWITYNGEVYNFKDIRAELAAEGVTFRSQTDTEVILKAYERWGPSFVPKLRGMFVFAIWDAHKRELFLARDRMGKKPLYYHQDRAARRMVFASEIRTLLASGAVKRKLNPNALDVYLFNGHMISPETIIKDVYSVMPSHWMRVNEHGQILETQRYWLPPVETDGVAWARDKEAVLEEVRATLAEAVKIRLMSDVPLGAFLSGGLDSSTVVALMAKASSDVRTFSIIFDEGGFDESEYSNWVAKRFNTRHSAVRITQSDFVRLLPGALDAMDQPSYDGPNTFCVSRAAREDGMTVALSGAGGDEIFGGYHEFRIGLTFARLHRALASVPLVREMADGIGRRQNIEAAKGIHALELFHYGENAHLNGQAAYVAGSQMVAMKFNWWARERLIDRAVPRGGNWFGLPESFLSFISEPAGATPPPIGMMSRLTSYVMMSERLMRDMDTMSSGVSLETRAPLTDHKFIEAAWKIPSTVRCAGAPEKPMQLELVRPLLGADYPYHRKQGFVFPFEKWVRGSSLFNVITDVLNERALASSIGLNSDALRTFTDERAGGNWYTIWTVFSLMRWCQANRVAL